MSSPSLEPPRHPVERLPEEWEAAVAAWGEPRYRGRQIFEWIHRHGVLEAGAMSNLPRRLRERVAEDGLRDPLALAQDLPAADGTRKLLVRTEAGHEVEAVLIPRLRDGDPDDDVVTECISSQVGCAMGCVFCASGIAGLKQNLSAAEIVGQVLHGRRLVGAGKRVRNVVLMGMGEPLHNYASVARALVLLCHDKGLGLSKRRVTLSTSGLVPQIDRLGADFGGQVQLAVSLHQVDDAARSAIMPINRKHPLGELMACLRRYPLPPRRRITIEYTLIRDENDSPRHADRLAKLLDGLRVKVNLIPMNPVAGSDLGAPEPGAVDAFRDRLVARGVGAWVRRTRGDDIAAACGQLALRGAARKRDGKVRLPGVGSEKAFPDGTTGG